MKNPEGCTVDYETQKKKEILLSQMHHDIMTPLNGITGLVYLMRKSLDNTQRMEEYLEKMEQVSEELKRQLEIAFELLCTSNDSNDSVKIATAPGERQPKAVVWREAEEQMLRGKTVLVVEDNEINLTIVSEILESWGCRIVKTCDGIQAVNEFAASRDGGFDCILMDIRMPYMNGYEATAKIRRMSRRDAQQIVIIALTANAYQSEAVKIKEAGMDGIITKPLHVNALRHLMYTLLKDRQKKTQE